ncbi:MAG: LamG domain-containing protein, partial [Proteobacteria bacterium]
MQLPFLTGYCDRLSVKPGDDIRFMISGDGADTAEVQIVRLIHGDENPEGPGFIEVEIDATCNGSVAITEQYTQTGSYMEIDGDGARFDVGGSFTLHAFVWSTTPTKGRQGILTRWSAPSARGVALGINDQGRLAVWIGDGGAIEEIASSEPLEARIWTFVAASYDAQSGTLALRTEPVINAYNSHLSPVVPRSKQSEASKATTIKPVAPAVGLLLAGFYGDDRGRGASIDGLYNGKIDRSGIHTRVLSPTELAAIREGEMPPPDGLLTYWDTTVGYTAQGIGDTLVDRGPHAMHGHGRNRPIRAMTGYNWSGRDDCFRLAPEQFGGIQYNDDAIIDCRWTPSFSWTVADDIKSGVYAARLRTGALEDHLVFFVRPIAPTAKIAMLMPTASYLAYANERFVLQHAPGIEAVTAHTLILHDVDYLLGQHAEWGRSSYDHHNDGTGVCHCSYRRPIMGLRPKHRMASTGIPWQFPADMSIIYWLEQCGYEYDVITDEDLDREGVDCLRPYRVVLNGTHSEYYSERMLDASEEYLAAGGRIMYLGANGYYWVVAFREDEPWCMEIRKLDSGSRAWQAAPGEHYMATNGDKGGIWRNRGRPPQKLTGVGFTSEGMDESQPYRRMPDSYDRAVSWVFDGVDNDVFGDYGLAQGGAAGI